MQSAAHGLRTDRRYRIQSGNYYSNCFRKHGWRRYCGNFIGKRRKEYKRSHDYYEKEFANGILFLKADGYHSNYDPKIQRQNNAVQNNNGQVNYQPEQNNQQPDNNQSNNGAQQNNQSSDNKPQNNNPSPPVTTAKPAVTNPPTTTTPKPQTEPPAPEPTEEERYMGIGRNLLHDGSDYSKAEAVYNWMTENGSGTCVNYSYKTYLICQGIGLDCYACWTDSGIYGHVANIVKVDGIWYVLDTQAGAFLDYNYGFTEVVDIDENHIADGRMISDYSYEELHE